MAKTTYLSFCEICKARFEGDDAEQKAIECEQSHPKSAEVVVLGYNKFFDERINGLPDSVELKFENGKKAKYRYVSE